MAQDTPGWELFRTFLGVLQAGSLSAAARELGLTQPTAGRHVAALEKALSLTLFTRSQTGLLPTDAARALQPYAESMAATAAALQREASSQADSLERVRGAVRITASEVIGVEVLPPILARLRQQQPGLVVELVISNRLQDLLHREADIAVRMTPPHHEALIAQRLGGIELGMHAHRDYLARRGTPRTEAELLGHDLIGFDTETPFIRALARSIGAVKRDAFALRTDNDLAQLAAIRAGHGIGFCQVGLAKRHGALVRVMPKRFAFKLDTWLAMHEDLRASPRCQVTFQALAEGLRAYIEG
ncbi:LysR family transcriptional regulator [Piscinibacter gummiphilus]|uniref:LysR family transcriptional regulator n=1 Tax=Piscinibacter gummiphilus TaxID=946333 RepID=A0ABZ0CSJ6_9BURK|nr:LysR family transcriptional regulator [Piscinibacter gummiphilus]WOB07968.1 LysR family transcriptional regulator [Piscinibacter gummiphilus]